MKTADHHIANDTIEKLRKLLPDLTSEPTPIRWRDPGVVFTECWLHYNGISFDGTSPTWFAEVAQRKIKYAITLGNLPIKVRRKRDTIYLSKTI